MELLDREVMLTRPVKQSEPHRLSLSKQSLDVLDVPVYLTVELYHHLVPWFVHLLRLAGQASLNPLFLLIVPLVLGRTVQVVTVPCSLHLALVSLPPFLLVPGELLTACHGLLFTLNLSLGTRGGDIDQRVLLPHSTFGCFQI